MVKIPWRDLDISTGYNATFYLTFRRISSFVPVPLHGFPEGTTFRFRALGTGVDINKSTNSPPGGITYNVYEKRIELKFVPTDTQALPKTMEVDYEMDCVYPSGERYPLCRGKLKIEKLKGLLTS